MNIHLMCIGFSLSASFGAFLSVMTWVDYRYLMSRTEKTLSVIFLTTWTASAIISLT